MADPPGSSTDSDPDPRTFRCSPSSSLPLPWTWTVSILVTGAAGFIGHHVADALLRRGDAVLGVDSLNDYYDPTLKHARLGRLHRHPGFEFERLDLADRTAIDRLKDRGIDRIVHLAAQAGVRHSIEHPFDYLDANLAAQLTVLELARAVRPKHFVFASSSSVYGGNATLPFSTEHAVDHPLSLYAATKRSGELMAHGYARLYDIPCTGLRFFSVYGTWGRPDMALWKFAEAIRDGRPIELYNHGRHRRDFTWIDDVVDGVLKVLDQPATPDPEFDPEHPRPDRSDAPFRLYNLGNDTNVDLLRYVELIEQAMGRTAKKVLLPKQPGDVEASAADVDPMRRDFGWEPTTPVEVGVPTFIDWWVAFGESRRAGDQESR
jgi:UDP-glucuronate 4-epimerase